MTALGHSNFLQALGWAVLNSLWQMALLWIVYQVITAVFKVNRASQKSSIATVLLFAGFTWFLFSFAVMLVERNNTAATAPFLSLDTNDALNAWLYKTLPVASALYLFLLVLPTLNFIRNYRYVQVIRSRGLTKADVQWRLFVQRISSHLGIDKPVQVWMSALVKSPVTIGYLKPIILLPVAAVSHLSTQQVEAVLLHELSHIRRFDYLINIISRIIQTVQYYNPFVRAFSKIIERERETSCDEMVMQFQYEPHSYASALLTLEKSHATTSAPLVVAASGNRKNELLSRIESIMGVRKNRVLSFNRVASVMAAVLCFIGLHALLLMSAPKTTKADYTFTSQLSAPYSYFTNDNEPADREMKASPIVNRVSRETAKSEHAENVVPASIAPGEPTVAQPDPVLNAKPADFSFVSLIESNIPKLDKAQEVQVKAALDASRRVLEEGQWKAVENRIADAMTEAEKLELKKVYQKAADHADWTTMADRLRIAYDQINWTDVNTQLNTALAEIKIDSLKQVCNVALASLNEIQEELARTNQKGVPDSDITVDGVQLKKLAIEKVVNKIRSVKARKIINL